MGVVCRSFAKSSFVTKSLLKCQALSAVMPPVHVNIEPHQQRLVYGDSDISHLPFRLRKPTKIELADRKINCSKVYVSESEYGDGAYAGQALKQGECIEWGLVRRLPDGFDGNSSEYVFTWSDDRKVWGMASGCAAYYNTAVDANTKMIRFLDEDRFEIYAVRDIAKDEALTHTYKSLKWRKCFQPIAEVLGVQREHQTLKA